MVGGMMYAIDRAASQATFALAQLVFTANLCSHIEFPCALKLSLCLYLLMCVMHMGAALLFETSI